MTPTGTAGAPAGAEGGAGRRYAASAYTSARDVNYWKRCARDSERGPVELEILVLWPPGPAWPRGQSHLDRFLFVFLSAYLFRHCLC